MAAMRKDKLIKFAALVIAAVAVVIVGAQLSAQTSATLLFKSGFENNTTLGTVSGNAPNSIDQSISGTDTSTNFNWSSLWSQWSPNSGLVGLHLIPPHNATDALSSHFENALDTSTAHSGSQSLLMKMTGYPNNNCCAQDVFNSVGMSQPVNQFYERVWIKFQPELGSLLSSNPGQYYRVLLETKSQSFRLASYVMADSNGNGYWYALADNNALQSSGCSPNCTTYWSQSNKSVAVPLNQWFLAEWNIVRSTSGGTYQMAINGTTVISHSGQTDQNPSEQLVMLAFKTSTPAIFRHISGWTTSSCGTPLPALHFLAEAADRTPLSRPRT